MHNNKRQGKIAAQSSNYNIYIDTSEFDDCARPIGPSALVAEIEHAVELLSRCSVRIDRPGLASCAWALDACRQDREREWADWLSRLGFRFVPINSDHVRRTLHRVGYRSGGLDESALVSFAHPLAQVLVSHRGLVARLGFAKGLLRLANEHDEVRSFYRVLKTGRLTTFQPHLQNTPRGLLRGFVVPRPGCLFLLVDMAAQEFVALAHLSQDPALLAAVHAGQDLHRAMAATLSGIDIAGVDDELRSRMKSVNLGVLYGKGVPNLAGDLNSSWTEAGAAQRRWKDAFPVAAKYLDDAGATAARTYRPVSPTGLEYQYPSPERAADVRRSGRNFPIQSYAAALARDRLLAFQAALERHRLGRVVLFIHDAFLCEVPAHAVHRARMLAERVVSNSPLLPFPVPIKIGAGASWREAEKNSV